MKRTGSEFLLDAGKTAAEVAIELDRTRHAIYGRIQRFYRKRAAEKLAGRRTFPLRAD